MNLSEKADAWVDVAQEAVKIRRKQIEEFAIGNKFTMRLKGNHQGLIISKWRHKEKNIQEDMKLLRSEL